MRHHTYMMKTMKRQAILLLILCCSLGTMANERYDNAVKITFLSWLTGSTKISYERAFPHYHQAGEICASVIGAGYDKFQNAPLGFTLRYGHKFFLGNTYDGGLKGFYIRPEAIYSHYDYNSRHTLQRTPARMATLLATTGYQTHFRHFIFDAWAGGGYAMGTPAETGYHHGFALWNLNGVMHNNIALSFSIRLGYCF